MRRPHSIMFVSLLLIILLFAPLVMKLSILPAIGLLLSGALRV